MDGCKVSGVLLNYSVTKAMLLAQKLSVHPHKNTNTSRRIEPMIRVFVCYTLINFTKAITDLSFVVGKQ